jgi:hypothetical protein
MSGLPAHHSASEKRADALHSAPKQGKSWISHLWPSEATLDKVSLALKESAASRA